MNSSEPISTIMTKNIIALTRSDDLERAEKLFVQHKIKHIPVVFETSIIGMLSYTDLMRISQAEESERVNDSIDSVVFNNFTIEQVMVKNIVTVSSDTTIKEVTKILSNREFHALPVVDNGDLVGMVTTRDLLKYFYKFF